MANNIPDFQKIMLPVLSYLKDEQPHPLKNVIDGTANYFKLTEEELKIKVPSGQMGLFKNRVAWAVSYLKNAGLVFYPQRGVYQITEVGKKTLSENLSDINIAYLKKFDGYKKWQSTFAQPGEAPTIVAESVETTRTPEEVIGDTFTALRDQLGFELLEILKTKPPNYFEYFVLQLLSKMGYGGAEESNFEVVGKSGDDGIDGIISQDKFGIDRIYVQAKRWRDNKVQSKDIRDFIGSLSLKGTNKGIFITTSEFTEDASRTANMNPQNRIILINGSSLVRYAIDYNVGVQIKDTFQIKGLDIDFFEDI